MYLYKIAESSNDKNITFMII